MREFPPMKMKKIQNNKKLLQMQGSFYSFSKAFAAVSFFLSLKKNRKSFTFE